MLLSVETLVNRKHAPAPDPWWHGGDGVEVCEHCFGRYAYEQEFRCTACDGPICPMCVASVTEVVVLLCPGCRAEEA